MGDPILRQLAKSTDPVQIITARGYILSSGKNLGVILRYSRTHNTYVAYVGIEYRPRDNGRYEALLTVQWADNARVYIPFASFEVLEKWIQRPSMRAASGVYNRCDKWGKCEDVPYATSKRSR